MTTPLPWDTEFFGIGIGRADPSEDLADVVQDAKRLGLRCVYIESAGPLVTPPGADLVLADQRVRLEVNPSIDPDAVNVRTGTAADTAALDEALERLVPWSRFSKDGRFGADAARRMYRLWLEQGATDSDHRLGIAEVSNRVAGFVTVRLTETATVALIAVTLEGEGVGQALLRWAQNLAAQHGASTLSVVTQSDNQRALAMYERAGFVRCETTLAYHLWLHPEDRNA